MVALDGVALVPSAHFPHPLFLSLHHPTPSVLVLIYSTCGITLRLNSAPSSVRHPACS